MLPSEIGMKRVESRSCDQRRVKGNCTLMYPVAGSWLIVVSEMTMFVGLVLTKFGLNVKEEAQRAVVIVTIELVPVVLEVSTPIVPKKREVCPDGYGFTTLPITKVIVWTKSAVKRLLRVTTLPLMVQGFEVKMPVELIE